MNMLHDTALIMTIECICDDDDLYQSQSNTCLSIITHNVHNTASVLEI